MGILIVDDSRLSRHIIKSILKTAGYTDIIVAESAHEAFKILDHKGQEGADSKIDLILMDIEMPGIDGIEACQRIKTNKRYEDIPIIVVTAFDKTDKLDAAFSSGAMDYIAKPVNEVELVARVRSALRLKQEIDGRKAREQELIEIKRQLEEANKLLMRIALLDGLTGVANRRHFEEVLNNEWKRALRRNMPLSLLMIDIDFFKLYNDTCGHLAGDECLKKVAKKIKANLKRAGDLAARYGGEEFAVILPDTDARGAAVVAERIRQGIVNLKIIHPASHVSKYVTVSLGGAAVIPSPNSSPQQLISVADKALYQAKQGGRNRVEIAHSEDVL